jgi:hypothetical protein
MDMILKKLTIFRPIASLSIVVAVQSIVAFSFKNALLNPTFMPPTSSTTLSKINPQSTPANVQDRSFSFPLNESTKPMVFLFLKKKLLGFII